MDTLTFYHHLDKQLFNTDIDNFTTKLTDLPSNYWKIIQDIYCNISIKEIRQIFHIGIYLVNHFTATYNGKTGETDGFIKLIMNIKKHIHREYTNHGVIVINNMILQHEEFEILASSLGIFHPITIEDRLDFMCNSEMIRKYAKKVLQRLNT